MVIVTTDERIWMLKVMEVIKKFVQRYQWQILLFVVLFTAKSYMNTYLYGLVQNTGNDEIGTIAGATLLTEFDWTNVISRISYYGFGYSIWMTPALLLINDAVLLHQILLMYNTVCICICAIICFNIQCHYLAVKDKKLAFFIALASVTFENNLLNTNAIVNEPALILILWITLNLLLHLKEKKDRGESNVVGTLCLAFVLIYGLLIHTRVIYIWGVTAVFIVLYVIYKRKCVINIPAFLAVFVCGYIAAVRVISYVQNILWKPEEGEVLNNSIQSLNGNLASYLEVFTYKGFKATVYTALGEIWGMTCLTGGLFAFAFVLMVIALIRFGNKEYIEGVGENFHFIVLTVTALYVAILGSVSLGAADAIKDVAAAGEPSKWYMYVRYTALVIGPIIMFTLVWLTNKVKSTKTYFRYQYAVVFVYIVIEFVFLLKIAPKFTGVSNRGSGEFLNYMALMGMEYRENFMPVHFIRILIISCVALGIILFCIKRNKKIFIPIIVLGLNIFSFTYVTLKGNSYVSQELYALFSEAYHCVAVEWEMNPDNCAIMTGERALSSYINSCQFSFPEWNIICQSFYDEEERENQIVFSATLDDSYLLLDYKLAWVNEDETSYMFIRGEEIEEKARESGYTLISSNEVSLERMLTNGESVKRDEYLQTYSDEAYVIFGPYIALEAGTYKVTYNFKTDKSTDLEFRTGTWVNEEGNFEEEFSFSPVGNKIETVNYILDLDEYTKNIELKIYIPQEIEFCLYSISVERVES